MEEPSYLTYLFASMRINKCWVWVVLCFLSGNVSDLYFSSIPSHPMELKLTSTFDSKLALLTTFKVLLWCGLWHHFLGLQLSSEEREINSH